MATVLDPIRQEHEFFNDSREEWLKNHEGKFALIKGRELFGTFDSYENAISEGYRTFKLEPFFVKQILREDPIAIFPALSLGLMRASL